MELIWHGLAIEYVENGIQVTCVAGGAAPLWAPPIRHNSLVEKDDETDSKIQSCSDSEVILCGANTGEKGSSPVQASPRVPYLNWTESVL